MKTDARDEALLAEIADYFDTLSGDSEAFAKRGMGRKSENLIRAKVWAEAAADVRSIELTPRADLCADPALLAEAGKVLEGVTPGPWTHEWEIDGPTTHTRIKAGAAVATTAQQCGRPHHRAAAEANARFIAWCREGVPALIALTPAPPDDAVKAREACAGCGKLTTGMCWTDCGMSLCGAPLCDDCTHVDQKYGWVHRPRAILRALEQEGR